MILLVLPVVSGQDATVSDQQLWQKYVTLDEFQNNNLFPAIFLDVKEECSADFKLNGNKILDSQIYDDFEPGDYKYYFLYMKRPDMIFPLSSFESPIDLSLDENTVEVTLTCANDVSVTKNYPIIFVGEETSYKDVSIFYNGLRENEIQEYSDTLTSSIDKVHENIPDLLKTVILEKSIYGDTNQERRDGKIILGLGGNVCGETLSQKRKSMEDTILHEGGHHIYLNLDKGSSIISSEDISSSYSKIRQNGLLPLFRHSSFVTCKGMGHPDSPAEIFANSYLIYRNYLDEFRNQEGYLSASQENKDLMNTMFLHLTDIFGDPIENVKGGKTPPIEEKTPDDIVVLDDEGDVVDVKKWDDLIIKNLPVRLDNVELLETFDDGGSCTEITDSSGTVTGIKAGKWRQTYPTRCQYREPYLDNPQFWDDEVIPDPFYKQIKYLESPSVLHKFSCEGNSVKSTIIRCECFDRSNSNYGERISCISENNLPFVSRGGQVNNDQGDIILPTGRNVPSYNDVRLSDDSLLKTLAFEFVKNVDRIRELNTNVDHNFNQLTAAGLSSRIRNPYQGNRQFLQVGEYNKLYSYNIELRKGSQPFIEKEESKEGISYDVIFTPHLTANERPFQYKNPPVPYRDFGVGDRLLLETKYDRKRIPNNLGSKIANFNARKIFESGNYILLKSLEPHLYSTEEVKEENTFEYKGITYTYKGASELSDTSRMLFSYSGKEGVPRPMTKISGTNKGEAFISHGREIIYFVTFGTPSDKSRINVYIPIKEGDSSPLPESEKPEESKGIAIKDGNILLITKDGKVKETDPNTLRIVNYNPRASKIIARNFEPVITESPAPIITPLECTTKYNVPGADIVVANKLQRWTDPGPMPILLTNLDRYTPFYNTCLAGTVNNIDSGFNLKKAEYGDYKYNYDCFTIWAPKPVAELVACDCVNGECKTTRYPRTKSSSLTLVNGAKLTLESLEYLQDGTSVTDYIIGGAVAEEVDFVEGSSKTNYIIGDAIKDFKGLFNFIGGSVANIVGAASGGSGDSNIQFPGAQTTDPDTDPTIFSCYPRNSCIDAAPGYCNDDGVKVNNCQECCPPGTQCSPDGGSCEPIPPEPEVPDCQGTPINTCTPARPLYCNSRAQLENKCGTCGCPSSEYTCQSNGACKLRTPPKEEAPLSSASSLINSPSYDYDVGGSVSNDWQMLFIVGSNNVVDAPGQGQQISTVQDLLPPAPPVPPPQPVIIDQVIEGLVKDFKEVIDAELPPAKEKKEGDLQKLGTKMSVHRIDLEHEGDTVTVLAEAPFYINYNGKLYSPRLITDFPESLGLDDETTDTTSDTPKDPTKKPDFLDLNVVTTGGEGLTNLNQKLNLGIATDQELLRIAKLFDTLFEKDKIDAIQRINEESSDLLHKTAKWAADDLAGETVIDNQKDDDLSDLLKRVDKLGLDKTKKTLLVNLILALNEPNYEEVRNTLAKSEVFLPEMLTEEALLIMGVENMDVIMNELFNLKLYRAEIMRTYEYLPEEMLFVKGQDMDFINYRQYRLDDALNYYNLDIKNLPGELYWQKNMWHKALTIMSATNQQIEPQLYEMSQTYFKARLVEAAKYDAQIQSYSDTAKVQVPFMGYVVKGTRAYAVIWNLPSADDSTWSEEIHSRAGFLGRLLVAYYGTAVIGPSAWYVAFADVALDTIEVSSDFYTYNFDAINTERLGINTFTLGMGVFAVGAGAFGFPGSSIDEMADIIISIRKLSGGNQDLAKLIENSLVAMKFAARTEEGIFTVPGKSMTYVRKILKRAADDQEFGILTSGKKLIFHKSVSSFDESRGGSFVRASQTNEGPIVMRHFDSTHSGKAATHTGVETVIIDAKNYQDLREHGDIGAFIKAMERDISAVNQETKHAVTGFAASNTPSYSIVKMNPDTGAFEYSLGGSNHLYKVGVDGTIERLPGTGEVLTKGAPKKSPELMLQPGERIISLSDGVLQGLGLKKINGRSPKTLKEVEEILEDITKSNKNANLETLQNAINSRARRETEKILADNSLELKRSNFVKSRFDDESIGMLEYAGETAKTVSKIDYSTPSNFFNSMFLKVSRLGLDSIQGVYRRVFKDMVKLEDLNPSKIDQSIKDFGRRIRLCDGCRNYHNFIGPDQALEVHYVRKGVYRVEGNTRLSHNANYLFNAVDRTSAGKLNNLLMQALDAKGINFGIATQVHSGSFRQPGNVLLEFYDDQLDDVAEVVADVIKNNPGLVSDSQGAVPLAKKVASGVFAAEVKSSSDVTPSFFRDRALAVAEGIQNSKSLKNADDIDTEMSLAFGRAGFKPDEPWLRARTTGDPFKSLDEVAAAKAAKLTSALNDLPSKRLTDLDLSDANHLGTGTTAKVYTQTINGEKVAVKIFREPRHIPSLVREAEFLTEMKGVDNVPTIKGVVTSVDDKGNEIIVGFYRQEITPLDKTWIDFDPTLKTLTPKQLVQYRRAVETSHAKGIANNDLEKGNIIIDSNGDLYVVDWGAAIKRGEPGFEDAKLRDLGQVKAAEDAAKVSKLGRALDTLPQKTLDDLGLALGDSSRRMNIDGENVYVTLFTESSSINQLRGVEILAEMKDSPGTARIRGVVTRIDDEGEKVIVGYYKENLSPLEGWEDIDPLKTPLSPAELKMYRETVEAAHAKGITHGNLRFDDMRGTFSTDDSGRFVIAGWGNALRRSDVGDAAFEARKARDLADVKAAEDVAGVVKTIPAHIQAAMDTNPKLVDDLLKIVAESYDDYVPNGITLYNKQFWDLMYVRMTGANINTPWGPSAQLISDKLMARLNKISDVYQQPLESWTYVSIGPFRAHPTDPFKSAQTTGRIYFNTKGPDEAIEVMDYVAKKLSEDGVSAFMKTRSHPEDYLRTDDTVLYLYDDGIEKAQDIVTKLARDRPELFNNDVPVFAKKLERGIGGAQKVPNEVVSFNQARASAVADAIAKAHRDDVTDPRKIVEQIFTDFEANDINPSKPWLRANTAEDIFKTLDNLADVSKNFKGALKSNSLVTEEEIFQTFGKALRVEDGLLSANQGSQKITSIYTHTDGEKYVVQSMRVTNDLVLSQEVAARKIASELGFSEFGIPPAVAYKGSDGKLYLISKYVDAVEDNTKWLSLNPNQRAELAAFAHIFGISDLNEGNFLFRDGNVYWIDFIGAFKRMPDVGPSSLDNARQIYEGRALRNFQGPYVSKNSLNSLDTYTDAIAKWKAKVNDPAFETNFRRILQDSGYPPSKIDEAVANVKENARNLQKNIADRIDITNDAILLKRAKTFDNPNCASPCIWPKSDAEYGPAKNMGKTPAEFNAELDEIKDWVENYVTSRGGRGVTARNSVKYDLDADELIMDSDLIGDFHKIFEKRLERRFFLLSDNIQVRRTFTITQADGKVFNFGGKNVYNHLQKHHGYEELFDTGSNGFKTMFNEDAVLEADVLDAAIEAMVTRKGFKQGDRILLEDVRMEDVGYPQYPGVTFNVVYHEKSGDFISLYPTSNDGVFTYIREPDSRGFYPSGTDGYQQTVAEFGSQFRLAYGVQ